MAADESQPASNSVQDLDHGGVPSADQVVSHLTGLLSRDPASFLEKYGKLLNQEELASFLPSSSDFEVAHWLRLYGALPHPAPKQRSRRTAVGRGGHEQAPITPTADLPDRGSTDGVAGGGGWGEFVQEGQAATSAAAAAAAIIAAATAGHDKSTTRTAPRLTATQKNRRLAAMQRMQRNGDFFSDESMRQRAPLLYHQLLGQYAGEAAPSCDPGQRPGCDEAAGAGDGRHAFSSMLMHQQQESMVRQRMEEEQEEEDAQMSEHDSDDENEEGEGRPGLLQGTGSEGGGVGRVGPWPSLKPISAKDLEINRREFLQEMELRFLYGQDRGLVDYGAIDADVEGELDDHWAGEAGRDAEDAYFDDMGGSDAEGSEDELVDGSMEYDY